MNRSVIIICGIAVVGLVPIGPNEFAKGFWGVSSDANPAAIHSTASSNEKDLAYQAASAQITKGTYRDGAAMLKKLAREGHAPSQILLGDLLVRGEGVPRDSKEAVRFWRLAGRHGNKDAALRLAAAYDEGIGVRRDAKVAFLWGKVAAIAGDATAQFNTAYMYIFGIGTFPNQAEGERWLIASANNGNERALQTLAEAKRQASLSPAQRAAERVVASGEPLTLQEMAELSRIINGERGPSAAPDYDAASKYAAQPMYRAGSAYSDAGISNILAQPLPPTDTRSTSSATRAWLDRQPAASEVSERTPTPDEASSRPARAPSGAVNARTGRYYAPSGSGYVNPQNGTYYVPSGPNGVVDTRTGSFIPISR